VVWVGRDREGVDGGGGVEAGWRGFHVRLHCKAMAKASGTTSRVQTRTHAKLGRTGGSDTMAGRWNVGELRLVRRSGAAWRWARTAARAAVQSDGPKAKKKGGTDQNSAYKDTVNLPQTKFNLRANAVQREPEIQKHWRTTQVYEKALEEPGREPFTLHDGPPYANGDLHIGHALNKILKDFICRYQTLRGRKVRFVPGWDCHGLPIELKVLQSLDADARKELTTMKLRWKAKAFAEKTVKAQKQQFKRYGIWGDWDVPYLTMDPAYEAAQIEVFGKMFLKGHIYRGFKPVHWSPSSKTALAEAELEYPEGHTSRSIYVSFQVEDVPSTAPVSVQENRGNTWVAIWTTTPWTIPANLAVGVNANLNYALAKIEGGDASTSGKFLLVAEGLAEQLGTLLGCSLTLVDTFKGSALEGITYRHPLMERSSAVVIGGDYITTESGTGLVHTAPGHGAEDFLVGLKNNLPALSPVDADGNFTEEAGRFAGLNVLGDGNQAIIDALTEVGALLKEEEYAHKYPYDWRTKKPTIFRATEQWFASVEGFRQEALEAIKGVKWIPAAGEKRITGMTEGRTDWCISRQRTWGVPIPVFYHRDTNEPLINEETLQHVKSIIAQKGSDAWFSMSEEQLLPESFKAQAQDYVKGTDTMDVWFDSGSSWAGVLRQNETLGLPADLYLEGSDQHRGWFQSSLLTSVATEGCAPYKSVLTHGFVLDERGQKMSKSLGNVVNPTKVIEGGKNQKLEPPYGADVLRLWVASVDYTGDVLIGENIIKQTSEVYRKIRGTLRFVLGNLHDFDPKKDIIPYEELPALDKYMLYRLSRVAGEITDAYDNFSFSRFYSIMQRLTVTELSNFYLDIAKDRLYIDALGGPRRSTCQTVLHAVLEVLLRGIAPVLPHMAEDAFLAIPYKVERDGQALDSIFQMGWFADEPQWISLDSYAVNMWDKILLIRGEVNKAMELARADKSIGASLEAKVILSVEDPALLSYLQNLQKAKNGVDELRCLFITSGVELVPVDAFDARALKYATSTSLEGVGHLKIGVDRADGTKCERCWNYSTLVGTFDDHPTLCERCHPLVARPAEVESNMPSSAIL